MSASREKRSRQAQEPDAAAKQTQPKKSNGKLYAVVGIIVAIAAVALLVWNSNFFQNRSAAVTINGVDYHPADVQYYYSNALQYQAYYALMGASEFDAGKSPKDQIYDEATGTTWHDMFLDQAVITLIQDVALATEAEKAGHTLSASAQAELDSLMTSLDANWRSSGYADRNAYLRANYGSTMDYDKFVKILERTVLASDYADAQYASYSFDQAELDAYYNEHKPELDSYTVSQFLFQANAPADAADPAAALEQAKAEAKAIAEEVLAKVKKGADPQKLSEEYADKITYSYISTKRIGASVNTEYADWFFDDARKVGDSILVEYEGASETSYNYCVAVFEGREQDNDPTANVRHILVSAGTDPSEQDYETAKIAAEALLEVWKSGDKSEALFAQMAVDNSADASSASSGGLLNVSEYSGYVDTFTDWSLDPARKSGDTGIIQNTGSATKGYHVMYFVDWNEPFWSIYASSALLEQAFSYWGSSILENYEAENGSGLDYVG